MITLKLKLPIYLKKIMVIKYGDELVLRGSSLLGMAISDTLMSKTYAVHRYRKNENLSNHYRYKELSEEFIVKISLRVGIRRGFEINDNKLHKLVRAIDKQIREELYSTALINKELYCVEYQSTLMNFLDQYNILEEELSYESLRKDFNRSKHKFENELKNIV